MTRSPDIENGSGGYKSSLFNGKCGNGKSIGHETSNDISKTTNVNDLKF